MIEKILELARVEIRKFKPYQSAKKIFEDAGYEEKICLDANLNPYPPYPTDGSTDGFNYYPEPQPLELKKILTKIYKVDSNNILLTRGGDEAIDLLVRAFCEPQKDSIVICTPTYGMYKISAEIQGADVLDIPLLPNKNFKLDVNGIFEARNNNSIKLIFIPSPNAPLGHLMNKNDILRLCKELSEQALIIIDEAYIEFANEPSFTDFLSKFPNLVVLRTLSKAYAMAGLRIGSCIGNPEIVQLLKNIQAPYPLTIPSINAAIKALQPAGLELVKKYIKELIAERDKLILELGKLPYVKKVFPSVTNFVLFEADNAEDVFDYCSKQGIILRSQTYQLLNTIRISVGTEQNNKKLIEILKKHNP